ncbi:Histone-lysine N-methyltransferase SETMAR [Melipona quadrifasciata]|uniref:Histone-lysine N-methyltransferase SETMAR n=1 Tax=Melipona quadrifasciata TaxID=166423 RepID=A0A0N0U7J3_9HYME|nr:Histone-lysine N-methyltransferase SETMAR [Melipona quadrifasciata]
MHFQHIMLHCFRKDNTATEICSVYGNDTTNIQTVRSWFRSFRTGNFHFEDEERSGRPSITDTEIIKAMVDENPRCTVRELADILKIPRTTVHNNLTKIGYVNHEASFSNMITQGSCVLTVRNKLLSFDWDVLPHPPYSPNIAPCDYYLFRSLENSLRGKKYNTISDIKMDLERHFTCKPQKFWKDRER